MSYNLGKKKFARGRHLFVAVLALGCAFGTVATAAAQNVTVPPTPTDITVPAGNTAFLVGHAHGSQGYICLPDPSTGGTSWTINPARPEATLFTKFFGQDVQIITHFASINANPKEGVSVPLSGNATWQSSFDTSKVWAKAIGTPVIAGT